MRNRTRLSPEQLNRMADLREKGWSTERISRCLASEGTEISASAIAWQCLRMGADLPPERRKTAPASRQPCLRAGRVVRPYTAEEDTLLRVLDLQGFKVAVIAQRMGRNKSSIVGRLVTLVRHDTRAEEAHG